MLSASIYPRNYPGLIVCEMYFRFYENAQFFAFRLFLNDFLGRAAILWLNIVRTVCGCVGVCRLEEKYSNKSLKSAARVRNEIGIEIGLCVAVGNAITSASETQLDQGSNAGGWKKESERKEDNGGKFMSGAMKTPNSKASKYQRDFCQRHDAPRRFSAIIADLFFMFIYLRTNDNFIS